MNAQDAAAVPIDVFRDGPPDLTPYVAAILPRLDPDALVTPRAEGAPDAETAAAIRRNDTRWTSRTPTPPTPVPSTRRSGSRRGVRVRLPTVPGASRRPTILLRVVDALSCMGACDDDDD